MKKWPLRWKVALYSALLAVAATIGGAVTTWYVLRYAEIAAFDRRLTMDAHEFFRDVENFDGGPANNRRVFKEIFVPLALRNRLVEVTDAKGTTALSFARFAPSRFPPMASRNSTPTRSMGAASGWRV